MAELCSRKPEGCPATSERESYGSGFIRVRDEIKKYPSMGFSYQESGNGFLVVLKYQLQKISSSFAHEGINEGVSEGVEALYMLIKANRGKRAPFFTKKLDTSEKNIERWLKQLKEEGKIEFRGAPKTGGYFPSGDDTQ